MLKHQQSICKGALQFFAATTPTPRITKPKPPAGSNVNCHMVSRKDLPRRIFKPPTNHSEGRGPVNPGTSYEILNTTHRTS